MENSTSDYAIKSLWSFFNIATLTSFQQWCSLEYHSEGLHLITQKMQMKLSLFMLLYIYYVLYCVFFSLTHSREVFNHLRVTQLHQDQGKWFKKWKRRVNFQKIKSCLPLNLFSSSFTSFFSSLLKFIYTCVFGHWVVVCAAALL